MVLAQARHLPQLGIELTDDPAAADVIACHVYRPSWLPRVDVLHLHALYFDDVPHLPFEPGHHLANRAIVQSIRESRAVTVPSEWLAMPLRRDMRLRPVVIPHGIDVEAWHPGSNLGYVLYNKNRESDVSSARAAYDLAARGVDVVSTFLPAGTERPPRMRVTGTLPWSEMKAVVAGADVYLATAPETFGIGTLEAMACGVPVLGWRWGATPDLVRHGVDGFLVEPGDVDGLVAGLAWIRAHREDLGRNAREQAARFAWRPAIEQYARLYHEIARTPEPDGVSVVVTNYNYGRYLPQALASLAAQTRKPDEIIVVDDGSTDDSREVLARATGVQVIYHATNQGLAAARNTGIEAARYPFIVGLDADDMLAPTYVETCARALAADRSLGVAYTGMTVVDERGERPGAYPLEFDWNVMTTPHNPPFNCILSGSMWRREMWRRAGGYRQERVPAEDVDFWLRGLSVGFVARKVSSEALFRYRVHPGSSSRIHRYRANDLWHPWMRDKQFPMGAPAAAPPLVRSYFRPEISVVVDARAGRAGHLPRTLDSLVGQTFRNWEAIVVAETAELPARVGEVYPFARCLPVPGAAGADAAHRTGLDHARGPLVVFLDAGEVLDPWALETASRRYPTGTAETAPRPLRAPNVDLRDAPDDARAPRGRTMTPELTIGLTHHSDFDGVFFTVQALRLYQDLAGCEIVVIDNDPDSPHGRAVAKFAADVTTSAVPVRYVPFAAAQGTSQASGRVFVEARGDAVLVLDCHVLLAPHAVARLKAHYAALDAEARKHLYTGPLLDDDLRWHKTHFEPAPGGDLGGRYDSAWRSPTGELLVLRAGDGRVEAKPLATEGPWTELAAGGCSPGQLRAWLDDHGYRLAGWGDDQAPFEVPAQGIGLFSVVREHWLGFNPDFRYYGGEQGYLQAKYRQHGRKTICLPFLQWNHRFGRPGGPRYVINPEAMMRNYLLGYGELGFDIEPIRRFFVEKGRVAQASWHEAVADPLGFDPLRSASARAGVPLNETKRPLAFSNKGLPLPLCFAGIAEVTRFLRRYPREIDPHVGRIQALAAETDVVVEVTRRRESTAYLLEALSEQGTPARRARPAKLISFQAERDSLLNVMSAALKGLPGRPVEWKDVRVDLAKLPELEPSIRPELLYLDTHHGGERLAAELVAYAPSVTRSIVVHGTADATGDAGGMRAAIGRFTKEHRAWTVVHESREGLGLTVLGRAGSAIAVADDEPSSRR